MAHSCDTPVAPHASEFLTQSCDQSQNVGPPHSCSSHPHGTHGVPDYTVPQNTSPRPQLVCFRLQGAEFCSATVRSSDRFRGYFVSGIHTERRDARAAPRSRLPSVRGRSFHPPCTRRGPRCRPGRGQIRRRTAEGVRLLRFCPIPDGSRRNREEFVSNSYKTPEIGTTVTHNCLNLQGEWSADATVLRTGSAAGFRRPWRA